MKNKKELKGVNCISQSAKYISPAKSSDSTISYSLEKKSTTVSGGGVNTSFP